MKILSWHDVSAAAAAGGVIMSASQAMKNVKSAFSAFKAKLLHTESPEEIERHIDDLEKTVEREMGNEYASILEDEFVTQDDEFENYCLSLCVSPNKERRVIKILTGWFNKKRTKIEKKNRRGTLVKILEKGGHTFKEGDVIHDEDILKVEMTLGGKSRIEFTKKEYIEDCVDGRGGDHKKKQRTR